MHGRKLDSQPQDSGPEFFRLAIQKIGGLCRKAANTRSDGPVLTYVQVPFSFCNDAFQMRQRHLRGLFQVKLPVTSLQAGT